MKYRKKPVVIEARQLEQGNLEEMIEWCGGTYWSRPPMRMVTGLTIPTEEGDMNAGYGDWIIEGVEGEFYPCKPGIFEQTYEGADDAPTVHIPTEYIESVDVLEVSGMTSDGVRSMLFANAAKEGYVPAATGWAGDAVVELRGRYRVVDDEKIWEANIYAMPVVKS